ncbi:hypothetical protein CRG98_036726 [Punica granatum]|uniref:MATH domain-containing protein n=1 Tax=Punica granatum TaxID=22663 RepID=A0A2I0IG33_PUNGR|nr:hypothetical protein CRG98_036726 [Punica granatum]
MNERIELINCAGYLRDKVDMDDQGVGGLVTHSGSLRWNIRGFSRLVEDKYWSETFTVNGCKWRILIYPKGNKVHGHLSLYLEVAEPERLPVGWRIEAKVCLAIINQYVPSLSAIRVTPFHVFLAEEKDWGLKAFKSLDEVTDCSRGLLVNDTITVEAKVDIYKVHLPRVARHFTETSKFDSYFTQLGQFVKLASDPVLNVEQSSRKQSANLTLEGPSKEEVKKAKQSLRECLQGAFKIDIKSKLYAALSTLSRAEENLSSEQKMLIRSVFVDFDNFIGGFITFENDRSKLELHKLRTEQLLSDLKQKNETHAWYKESLENLTGEEEELEMRLEELRSKRTKLISDWGALMSESEEVKSSYVAEQKKIIEVEEQMKKSEEGRARSDTTWARLKDLLS